MHRLQALRRLGLKFLGPRIEIMEILLWSGVHMVRCCQDGSTAALLGSTLLLDLTHGICSVS